MLARARACYGKNSGNATISARAARNTVPTFLTRNIFDFICFSSQEITYEADDSIIHERQTAVSTKGLLTLQESPWAEERNSSAPVQTFFVL